MAVLVNRHALPRSPRSSRTTVLSVRLLQAGMGHRQHPSGLQIGVPYRASTSTEAFAGETLASAEALAPETEHVANAGDRYRFASCLAVAAMP